MFPVGLIHTSLGEVARSRPWPKMEEISNIQKVDLKDVDINKTPNRPLRLPFSNSMINRDSLYHKRSLLAYRGTNSGKIQRITKKLFPCHVKRFGAHDGGIGDFPFYSCKLRPTFMMAITMSFKLRKISAFIRETQLQCLDLIPNSGHLPFTMEYWWRAQAFTPPKERGGRQLLFNALNQILMAIKPLMDCRSYLWYPSKQKDGGLVLKFKNSKFRVWYALMGFNGFWDCKGKIECSIQRMPKLLTGKTYFV